MTVDSETPPAIPEPFSAGPVAVAVRRDVIAATGPDTEAFLQGQLSQDVATLADGESAWSLLLQPQGKVAAWLRITRRDATSFLLDVDAGAGDATLARLSRFKLRTKCDFEPATWDIISVRGPGALAVHVAPECGAEVVVPSAWPGIDGFDALGPTVTAPDGLATATPEDLNQLRIVLGIPAMGAELTEATIPAEAGIVERSVSFTKGCYTGQELVARIDSRGGNVPRRLRILAGTGQLSAGGSILVDGEDVGEVTSASGTVALGYVKRAVDQLPVEALAGGVKVTIHPVPA